jgi:predicted transposase/invertase (TIGR01784 family)
MPERREKPRYINPYTDFGFKRLFGVEANKDLLIDFLNHVLPRKYPIVELTFGNTENIPELEFERKAIFDIHCKDEKGETFIVEMQKAKIKFFKDRALFYVSFPIRTQAKRGPWNFELDPIYYLAILDFKYDEDEERQKFERLVNLKDQDGDLFYDKLNFKFLQMPLFLKKEHELVTQYDKWCFFLKHLEEFDDIPTILNEPIFQKAFKTAEIAKFSQKEYDKYQESLLNYIELKSAIETSREEGREEGKEIGKEIGKEDERIKIAIKMIKANKTIEEIIEFTELSKERIEALIKELKG